MPILAVLLLCTVCATLRIAPGSRAPVRTYKAFQIDYSLYQSQSLIETFSNRDRFSNRETSPTKRHGSEILNVTKVFFWK